MAALFTVTGIVFAAWLVLGIIKFKLEHDNKKNDNIDMSWLEDC